MRLLREREHSEFRMKELQLSAATAVYMFQGAENKKEKKKEKRKEELGLSAATAVYM